MKVVLHLHLKSDEEAIETILEAVKKAGYEPGKDFQDCYGCSIFRMEELKKVKDTTSFLKAGTEYTAEELIEHWAKSMRKISYHFY